MQGTYDLAEQKFFYHCVLKVITFIIFFNGNERFQ